MAYAVGLMSGTSLDGIDVALVNVTGFGKETNIQLIDFLTVDFPIELYKKIVDCINLQTSDVRKICSLNFELGYTFANAVKDICNKAQIALSDLEFIGSHGQTIFHLPLNEQEFFASTLQIGEPAVIAFETNTTVVSNFRTMDMAAGGQGAPLVPFSEWILFSNDTSSRLLQNIGGIGNVTVLKANANLDDVFAFDTGPGNMIIDEICKRLFNVPYDESGNLAAKGEINKELLDECMSVKYICAKPPKTTGRELFGYQFVTTILKKYKHLTKYDILATMTMFTALSIVKNYELNIFPYLKIDEVIISGGGSYNTTLVNWIKELIKDNATVKIAEEIGYSSAAKEAIAFAILANETLHNNPSNVKTATGAKYPVILGNITYPPR